MADLQTRIEARNKEYSDLFRNLRALIETRNKEYSNLFRSKDWKSLAKLYADDCTFMPPGIPMHRGREGIAACLAGFASRQDMFQVTVNTEDIICAGNELIVERGTSLVYKKDGTIVEDGKYTSNSVREQVERCICRVQYIQVWKRAEGTIQLYVDIWNTNNSL